MSAPDPVAPLTERHLVDSTAWSKVRTAGRPDLAEWFNAMVRADLVATCEPVVLELLRSARNAAAFIHQSELLELLPLVPTGPHVSAAPSRCKLRLPHAASTRRPPVDLLIAASAEAAGLPLLHYDHDFDLIADVTRQPCRWLLPAGTLP